MPLRDRSAVSPPARLSPRSRFGLRPVSGLFAAARRIRPEGCGRCRSCRDSARPCRRPRTRGSTSPRGRESSDRARRSAPSPARSEQLLERRQRRDVEIVGRLVEQEQVGARLEDLRERDARALAARERADLLALLRPVEQEILEVACASRACALRARPRRRRAAPRLRARRRCRGSTSRRAARRAPDRSGRPASACRARLVPPRARARRPPPSATWFSRCRSRRRCRCARRLQVQGQPALPARFRRSRADVEQIDHALAGARDRELERVEIELAPAPASAPPRSAPARAGSALSAWWCAPWRRAAARLFRAAADSADSARRAARGRGARLSLEVVARSRPGIRTACRDRARRCGRKPRRARSGRASRPAPRPAYSCARYSSSQAIVSASRWFVGSSRIARVGLATRIWASATRRRSPPLSVPARAIELAHAEAFQHVVDHVAALPAAEPLDLFRELRLFAQELGRSAALLRGCA